MLNADWPQHYSVNTRLHACPETNTKLLVFSAKINCFNA